MYGDAIMINPWLLEPNIREIITHAERNGLSMTQGQQDEFEAALSGAAPSIMSVADDKVEIAVRGVLTQTPNFLAMFLGGGNTTYPDIISALSIAEADDTISEIILSIDSPGGSVNGLFDTLDAIRATTKPVKAVILNTAASAAYAIATQADEIVASNRATQVGSIGIAASFMVSENIIDIASTNAPKKRPDVSIPEGVDIIREQLDPLHDLFVDAIVDGRNNATGNSITSKIVNSDFGQGAMLLANEALKAGMIDSIAPPKLSVVGTSNKAVAMSSDINIAKQNKEGKAMTLEELKAQHPALFAAAVKGGIEVGATQERDRVMGHLIMGQTSGDMKTALEAVKEGSVMTQELQAIYMSAALNRADAGKRTGDDDDASAVLDGAAAAGSEEPSAADVVADAVVAKLTGNTEGVKGGEANA